jgi:hypothetical protein
MQAYVDALTGDPATAGDAARAVMRDTPQARRLLRRFAAFVARTVG